MISFWDILTNEAILIKLGTTYKDFWSSKIKMFLLDEIKISTISQSKYSKSLNFTKSFIDSVKKLNYFRDRWLEPRTYFNFSGRKRY